MSKEHRCVYGMTVNDDGFISEIYKEDLAIYNKKELLDIEVFSFCPYCGADLLFVDKLQKLFEETK